MHGDRRPATGSTGDDHHAAELLDAFFDAAKAKAIAAPGSVESDPIVADRDLQLVVVAVTSTVMECGFACRTQLVSASWITRYTQV